jgi:methionyl-tRNA synthetase
MALKVAKERGEDGKELWNKSTICHFIGKDIVYHHYLFLPSMRMGEGSYRLPDFIPTRGHLLLHGRKISKSRHWSITIADFLRLFPPDYLRFYLARIVPYSQSDADFSWDEFREKINNELVANIGNFAYRSLVFVKNRHGSVVPEPGKPGSEETEVLEELRRSAHGVESLIEQGHYDRALKRILDFSSKCNQYFQHRAPWEDEKGEATTIFYSCNLVAGLAILLYPFLPFSSDAMWSQLGFREPTVERSWDSVGELNVKPGQRIVEPKPLFKKVEETDRDEAEKILG